MNRRNIFKYLLVLELTVLGFVSVVSSVLADCEVVILDFESLRVVDSNTNHGVGLSFTEDGMTVSAVPIPSNLNPDLNYAGTLSTSFAGSTMLFHHISGGEILLTRNDGGLFDLLSILLAELPAFDCCGTPVNFGPFDVTFVGTRENGRTVSFTATVQPFPETNTFKFKGFSRLTSVTWHQGAGGGPGLSTHQFDNIVVRSH